VSVYGWRWWDIARDGSLQSVNGDLWPPNDPVLAECKLINAFGHDLHQHEIIMPDGRRRNVPNTVTLGKRKNGVEVIREGPPAFNCHCGMWAYYDPEGAWVLPQSHGHTYLRRTKVFGVIEAWGNIVWMDLGFRCEIAQVRAVVVTRGKLHRTYENLTRYPSMEAITKEWDVTPLDGTSDWGTFSDDELRGWLSGE
jgi:hypothetical protein